MTVLMILLGSFKLLDQIIFTFFLLWHECLLVHIRQVDLNILFVVSKYSKSFRVRLCSLENIFPISFSFILQHSYPTRCADNTQLWFSFHLVLYWDDFLMFLRLFEAVLTHIYSTPYVFPCFSIRN